MPSLRLRYGGTGKPRGPAGSPQPGRAGCGPINMQRMPPAAGAGVEQKTGNAARLKAPLRLLHCSTERYFLNHSVPGLGGMLSTPPGL